MPFQLQLANTYNLTQIDDDDIKKVLKYLDKYKSYWYEDINGYAIFRITRLIRQDYIYLHNLVFGKLQGYTIDHIDGNKLNNKKENLRFASVSENSWNTGLSKANNSGSKGVSYKKENNKWIAQIRIKTDRLFLGSFVCKIRAAEAYNKAALLHHGDFAYQNDLSQIVCECRFCSLK